MARIKKKRRRRRRFVFYCAREGCPYHQVRLITRAVTLEEAAETFGSKHAYLKMRQFPFPCVDPGGHQWQEAGKPEPLEENR